MVRVLENSSLYFVLDYDVLLLTNVFVEMSHAALYFLLVSFIAALVGQHFLRKILKLFGRASIIIFILASIIFISAILLGIYQFSFLVGHLYILISKLT
jgi:hypothetical protein